MDEKPKSIWKKSWKLPGLFLLWLILMVVTMLIFSIGILMTGDVFNKPSDFGGLLIFGVIAATILLCLWIFIRWLCRWRNFKRFLFGCACFATLIALFYAEEDWRGKHDWEKFKRQWEAKGEHFDFASVIPPPVPDDQNFAFSPVWIAEEKYLFQNTPERAKAWYGDQIYSDEIAKIEPRLPVSTSGLTGTNWITAHNLPNTPQESYYNWTTAQAMDLKPWQAYYRKLEKIYPAAEIPVAPQPQTPAQDVLLALSKFDPVIEELRQDSAKPYSRFPIQYDGMPAAILLPHLSAEKRYAQVLQLRAVAELQNGESKKALDDVKLMLCLTGASRTEPFFISQLVRIAISQITLQPIYEGLAEHKWSDAQLADLDSELAKLDFLADYEFAVRGERALCIANIEFLRHPDLHNLPWKHPRLYFLAPFLSLVQVLSSFASDEGPQMHNFQTWALSFGPSGWLYQNEIRIAQFETKWYLPIVDEETETISPAKVRAAGNALGREIRHQTPENVLETLLMPSLGGGAERFAYAQSSVDLARVAIALERYRLAHGGYPDSLDTLAPQFIAQVPHDIIGGGPLHYRLTSDPSSQSSDAASEQFVLYSIGWNDRDDGGVVVLKKGSTGEVDRDAGDWVWRYPQE